MEEEGLDTQPGTPALAMVKDASVGTILCQLLLAKGAAQGDREGPHPIPALTWLSKGPFHSQSPCNLLSFTTTPCSGLWVAVGNPRQPLQAWSCPAALFFLPRKRKPGAKTMRCPFHAALSAWSQGLRSTGLWLEEVCVLEEGTWDNTKICGVRTGAGLGSNLLCDLG